MNLIEQNNIFEQIRLDCLKAVTLCNKQATRFFKVNPGSYAAHDLFLGVRVPDIRKIARKYQHIDTAVIEQLLQSAYNEERLLGLIILVHRYRQSSQQEHKKQICDFYLHHLNAVNNWNLVDSSAQHILGDFLKTQEPSLLYQLAASDNIWHRRIAIIATHAFIKNHDLNTTFKIAHLLIHDKEDLIHKAVGWMLREAGKINQAQLREFIDQHSSLMPKTMLRYACEKLSFA